MKTTNSSVLFLDELIDIVSDSISIELKYTQFRIILEKTTKELTDKEALQFSNLFSRLSFVCDKHEVSKAIHGVRIVANKVLHEGYHPSENEYRTHIKHLANFIAKVYCLEIPEILTDLFPEWEYQPIKTVSKNTLIGKLRVEIINIEEHQLICYAENSEQEEFIKVMINELGISDRFTSVDDFWKGAQLYLVNIEVDEFEVYHPKFIILEPDYLLDVSSIAECMQDYGISELNYIKSKFEAVPNSRHIRLGNFANLVIDELFAQNEQEVSFSDTFEKDFKAFPFEYTTCTDLQEKDKFITYWKDAQTHFLNIKRVIDEDFPKLNISIENASLEPSFLSELYGIQGRLDILELKDKNKGKSKIIELKSGGVPFPNDGKSIKLNHQSQLYLYYQLIGVLNELGFTEVAEKTEGYILYSKIEVSNIRLDKPNLTRVQDILNLRNKMIINEYTLALDDIEVTKSLISKVTPDNLINNPSVHANFRALLEPQINEFFDPLSRLKPIEQTYFYSFVSFIAKEHYLSKLGNGQKDKNNGLANLWLNSFTEKKESFEILYDLTIAKNRIAEDEKEIVFKRTNMENEFVSFRKGDACILYPRNTEKDSAISNQIFKCSIKELSKHEVTVHFRFKQRNTVFFNQFDTLTSKGFWALERDFMDSSFRSMYKNMYSFITEVFPVPGGPFNKK